jgi:hypothetical protein
VALLPTFVLTMAFISVLYPSGAAAATAALN